MQRSSFGTHSPIVIKSFGIALLLLAIVAPASLAVDPPAEPKTMLERLDLNMHKTRQMIQNASMKLRNGIRSGMTTSVDSPTLGRAAELLPAEACCSSNLDWIDTYLTELESNVKELRSCYLGKTDRQTMQQFNVAAEDIQTLGRANAALRVAATEREAQQIMGAMQRAYILLQKTRETLPDCAL